MQVAVGDRARIHPAIEHGADGAPQLLVHVLREGALQIHFDFFFVARDQLLQIVGREVGVLRYFALVFHQVEQVFEMMMVNPQHHIGIHLNEAAVRIIRKARIASFEGKAFHGFVIQAEIEDRIHHAGHAGARARTH